MLHQARYKQLEFVFLFAVIPLLLALNILPLTLLMPTLWLMSLYAFFVLKTTHGHLIAYFFNKEQFITMLKRFVLASGVFMVLSYFLWHDAFLSIVQNEPLLFLLLVLLYPLVSVIPQEILYRAFFFTRYSWSFSEKKRMVLSAFFFAFAHVAFVNIEVLLLVFMGGLVFAHTYIKSRSLLLVCIEHTLYGYVLFISGVGELFFKGGTMDLLKSVFG